MSYDTYDPRLDPFFEPEARIQKTPKSAEGAWPDHCQQSGSNRKIGLSSHPVFDENFVPPHGDTVTALAKARYKEKEK